MRIEDDITIKAPVATVWHLTEDVEAWPGITPTITSVERLDDGPIGVGARARLKQPGQRPAVWTVTRFEPNQAFAWETKVLGVRMTGSHLLTAVPEGCRNTLTLQLEGPAARLLALLAGKRLRQAIATENAGFKTRAEAG